MVAVFALVGLSIPFAAAAPSVILSGGFTEAEAQAGSQQRKIVYASGNWYAFYADAGTVFYKKSADGVTWGSAVTLDSANTPFAPTAWVEGATIYVGWLRGATDAIAVNTINTASSDTLGTQCTTGDLGGFSSATVVDFPSIAVADNGTAYVAMGGDTTAIVEKLTFSGCTFTDITTGSGLTQATEDMPTVTTIGNSLHMVFNDDDGLSHSVYDGTSWTTVGGTFTEADALQGGQQRKIVYASSNWYAFYADSNTVSYEKSSDGVTWGSAVTVDSTSNPFAPTAWVEGTTIYVAWLRDTGDGIAVNTINTASSDALGTQCTTGDLGTFTKGFSNNFPSLGVADDGTVYVAVGGTATETVEKLVFSGCTFTDIETESGLTNSDVPTLTTIGNSLHMVFQDGDLSHSIYDGTSWTASNTQIAAQTDSIYSLTTDATNLWLLTVDSTTAAAFYKFNGSTWSTETSPWTSQTNLTSVSLTYDSTNSDLVAMSIKDTSEQAYFISTDTTTISWGSETSSGFTAGDLGHISSPQEGAGTSQIAVTLRNAEDYMFSNLTPARSSVVDFESIDADVDTVYSLTTDGTSLWLLTVDDTTAAALYKCATCPTTSPVWSNLTAPWTGLTNLTSVSITYDSDNSDLYSFAIHDTSEQAYWESTDATTISWSSETSLAFTAGDLGHISSPEATAAGTSKIAATVRQGANFEFAWADTTAPTTPGTPSTASPTTSQTPTWTWTVSTDSGAGLHATEAYIVEWSTDSSFASGVSSSTAATASFTHSTVLTDETTWYFRVYAKDAVDNESSVSSNGSLAIDTTPPSPGGGTSGSAAAGTVHLQQQGFLPPPAGEPPPPVEPVPPPPPSEPTPALEPAPGEAPSNEGPVPEEEPVGADGSGTEGSPDPVGSSDPVALEPQAPPSRSGLGSIISELAPRLEAVLASPVLQEVVHPVTVVVTPVGVAAGAIPLVFTGTSISSFYELYLWLLRFLFAVLSSLGIIKRPRPWGTVYDAVTKRPLDPVYVTIEQNSKKVAEAITDIDGRYGFFIPPGVYTLKVKKTHYAFPSLRMKGKDKDELYKSLYYGEPFLAKAGEAILRDIPMDPIGFDWNEYVKYQKDFFVFYSKKHRLRTRIFNILFFFGFFSSIFLALFYLSIPNFLILLVYIAILLFRMFRARGPQAVVVKSSKTGVPIPFALIRLFSSLNGKQAKATVADNLGRFYILVAPGEYFLTVEEKQPDGSYRQVLRSQLMKLKKGVLENDIGVA